LAEQDFPRLLAILLYLGEKTGKYLPTGLRDRVEVTEWLFCAINAKVIDGGSLDRLLRRKFFLQPAQPFPRRMLKVLL
jgi:glutathione S-transferase